MIHRGGHGLVLAVNRHLRAVAAVIALCLAVGVAAVISWDDGHSHRLALRSEGSNDSGSVIDIAPGPDTTTTVPSETSTSSPLSSGVSGSSGKSADTGSPT